MDDTGKIIREVKVASEPEALLAVLKNPTYHFKRIGWKPGRCRNGYSALSRKQALRRDASHEGGVESTDQQDGPQRCARMTL